MTRALVFPGQGSQAVGMGKELAEAFPIAREVFQEVDDALSQKLSALMFEGPENELTLTENAQPALMAVSLAVTRVLEKEGGFTLTQEGESVIPLPEMDELPVDIPIVYAGILVDKVYELSLVSRTFSADGYIWLEWPTSVQELMEADELLDMILI